MNQALYEVVALGARYVFAGLMLLIVLRAWRITLVDSRRAAALRRMSPQTGLSGELVVIDGGEKARHGMKYPVIREGMIGTSRRADIRIRHSSVRRRHAYFQLTKDGLRVRAHAGAPMRDGYDRPARSLTLPDGAELSIGDVRLLLVLTQAPEPPAQHHRHERRETDAAAPAPDPDALFREQPVLRHQSERRPGQGIDVDAYFDIDEANDGSENW
ncbi:MAG: hypothetical protein IJ124_08730 [Clostridia bacterium]|nr:hypothetical protein [Clostridia bacterium]